MVSVAGTDNTIFYTTATGPTADRACGSIRLATKVSRAPGCVMALVEGVNFRD